MGYKYLLLLGILLSFTLISADSPYSDCTVYGNCKTSLTGTTNINLSLANVNNSLTLLGFNWTDNIMGWITSATANNTYALKDNCQIVETTNKVTTSGVCTLADINALSPTGYLQNLSSASNRCLYVARGSINVTGTLIMESCTLEMNNSVDGAFNLYINNRANLIMNYSNITKGFNLNWYNFKLLTDSNVLIKNSVISYMGSGVTEGIMGIYINTTKLQIDNLTTYRGYNADIEIASHDIELSKIYDLGDLIDGSVNYNLYCSRCSNVTIRDSNLSDSDLTNVVVSTNQKITFINTNYSTTNTVSSGASVTRKYTTKVKVTDKNGNPVLGAVVDGYNRTGGYDTGGVTNVDGNAYLDLTEYIQFGGATKTYWVKHNISISKDYYTKNISMIINISNIADRDVTVNLSDYVASIYNVTYHGLINNASYLSTYNKTYNGVVGNATYLTTYNATYNGVIGNASYLGVPKNINVENITVNNTIVIMNNSGGIKFFDGTSTDTVFVNNPSYSTLELGSRAGNINFYAQGGQADFSMCDLVTGINSLSANGVEYNFGNSMGYGLNEIFADKTFIRSYDAGGVGESLEVSSYYIGDTVKVGTNDGFGFTQVITLSTDLEGMYIGSYPSWDYGANENWYGHSMKTEGTIETGNTGDGGGGITITDPSGSWTIDEYGSIHNGDKSGNHKMGDGSVPITFEDLNLNMNANGINQVSHLNVTDLNATNIKGKNENLTGNLVVGGNLSAKRYYYSGYDNSTQTMASTSSAQVVNVTNNADYDAYGITIVNKQNITFQHTGDYLILFQPEFYQATGSNKEIQFWFQKNGVDIPFSNTAETMINDQYLAVPISIQVDIENPSTDNVRIMWWSDSTSSQIITRTGLTSPTRPSIPGVIINIQKVSELTP